MPTYRTSTAGGSTSGTGNRTVAITPAVGDLLVVYCFVSTNTNDSPTCTDNNGSGTYTLIDVANVVISSVNHRLSVFVRNALMVNTTATTITVATGSNTSGAVHCIAVSGMVRTGLTSAVRSKGLQNNVPAAIAAPTLNQSALTGNLTIVAQGSADTTTTPPTNWTERQDTNFATPTIAMETATRDSGFTGTTITFGAGCSTQFCSHALELDSTTPLSTISGSADMVFDDGSSTLTGAGALVSSTPLVLEATGTGIGVAAIVGTSTLTLSASGRIYHPITQLGLFGYTQPRYGSFYRPPGRMFGSAAITISGSATANQQEFRTGTASLSFDAKLINPRWTTQLGPHMWTMRRYGDFSRPAESSIEGTASLAFGGAALLIGQAPIGGTTDLAFEATGTVIGTGNLIGSAAIQFTAEGLLDLPSGEVVGTAHLVFSSAATLTGSGVLIGLSDLTFVGEGSAVAFGELVGLSDLIFTGSGTLTTSSLAGVAEMVFSASAFVPSEGIDNRDAAGLTFSTRSTPGIANATRSKTGNTSGRTVTGRLPN